MPAVGTFLFVAVLSIAIAFTLPDDFLLSAIRTALGRQGIRIDAREARFRFPAGIRLTGVSVAVAGYPPVPLDEVTLSWEWTGLFRWLPARLGFLRGTASGDFRFSPAVWNPSRGTVSLNGISSADLPLPVFSASGAGFTMRRADAKWRISGGKLAGDGSASLEHLRIPVPAPQSPIREARIDNVDLAFAVRGDTFRIARLAGFYEGSRVDGTGEITGLRNPAAAGLTLHLRVQNPFEGRIATMFDMLAKNAKNANLRIVGTLAAPQGEFRFF
ncbi:MAG TPA: type II secretion system protein GspN [Candidatus Deferrimicrobiaceae bacterium]